MFVLNTSRVEPPKKMTNDKLLRATNGWLTKAEPLFRQVLRILAEFGRRTGHEHPHIRTVINNYAGLIAAMGVSQDAIAAACAPAIEGDPRVTETYIDSLPRSVTGTLDRRDFWNIYKMSHIVEIG
jgi:hypothetical protein